MPSSKKKEEEDVGPIMTLTVPLQQRVKDEKNMRVSDRGECVHLVCP